ncbi:MAG: 4'-phosphopantetheinyl transferase superfamily protein [Oscillospiraceae bacterium]|nr:4'-phosphopantetheinyl transferase superfamily protein [Oscillospiraceae bacterium]
MITLRCVTLPEDSEALYDALYRRATPERKQRADRYLRREDGLRCLAAGELLRRTVEQELGITEFTVVKDPGGKPRIAGQDHFHYNLSHSGSRVVIACGDSPVGVDVQQMCMDAGKENLAKRFFTQEEQAYVFASPEQTGARFYRVWTGKESYLKYLGTGLKKSLDSFSILSPEISHMLKIRYLPDGYCVSLCSSDQNCIFVLDDQPFQ